MSLDRGVEIIFEDNCCLSCSRWRRSMSGSSTSTTLSDCKLYNILSVHRQPLETRTLRMSSIHLLVHSWARCTIRWTHLNQKFKSGKSVGADETDYLLGEGPSELVQGVNVRVASIGPHDLNLTFFLQPIKDVCAEALCDACVENNPTALRAH